ncbi:YkgB [Phlyctema vagabunda]|uniref:YkgB n=1 Tax=Phlyctema vagabunda TaxID=108571 RepID=A0ABR4PB84_9HELO
MLFFPALLLSASMASTARAVTLFATAGDGNLTTLSLTRSTSSNASSYALSIAAVTGDCDPNGSWLSIDRANSILYCLDRGSSSSTAGSLNSFRITGNESKRELELISRVDVPPSGYVDLSALILSFNKSAIALVEITDPSTGTLNPILLETLSPTIPQPGPVVSRQDRSYSHQVLVSPDGSYVYIADLGGDFFRVFSYDLASLAPLTQVATLHTDPGTGPRHGVFRTREDGGLTMYFVGELSQKVYSYAITETRGGTVEWTKLFEVPVLGEAGELPATLAPVSEIQISPDEKFLLISSREQSFVSSPRYQSGPSDTIASFAINQEDESLSLIQLAPSGGYLPRQFSLNKDGSLVAVGHQTNRTVVIWERDVASGLIATENGPLASVVLSGAVACTLWDE